MAGPEVSPISQLLNTLGITREDLMRRSDQMRQFLTADDAVSSRVFDHESARPRSGSDIQSNSTLTRSSRSLARSLSCASSSSLRDGTPPTTPVKTEPHEIQLPHRRMDSMEMIIERQRRQRRSRKGRERESSKNQHPPPSPSPSAASHFGVKATHRRDDLKINNGNGVPEAQNFSNNPASAKRTVVTPSRYYREHTNMVEETPKDETGEKIETPTRPTQVTLQDQSAPYCAYPALVGYQHYLPMAYRAMQASTSVLPVTPQANRTQSGKTVKPPLPSSSPPPVISSPMSSPSRQVVNLVSSPGPMGSDPLQNGCDDLPYMLPLGPYPTTKPDLSYAALIGRAILSSPEHRLTLQEIYDWITIVFPYYKRGETTWMNSIRHVLSTTVVFRKVPRDRSVGRTLWAIYDEDLECFKDGGFKKHLCKDYANSSDYKGKGKSKRRTEDDETTRKPKRARREATSTGPSTESNIVHSSFIGRNNPIFPTPHLQPYYQSCLPQLSSFPAVPVPVDIIFPPLPPSAALGRIVNTSLPSSAKPRGNSLETDASSHPTLNSSSPTPISSTASSSVPELTPNRTSSSPLSSMPATSDIDVNMHDPRPASTAAGPNSQKELAYDAVGVDADTIFNTSLLGPVKLWRDASKGTATSGFNLLDLGDESEDEIHSVKNKKLFPTEPTSPTLRFSIRAKKAAGVVSPSTPPRTTHQTSSVRTPLSYRGINMVPSPSLAHYKSNLDPPPALSSGIVPLDLSQRTESTEDEVDLLRTPRKRANFSSVASVYGHPMTPKRLNFSNIGDSPYRTPRLKGVIDPIDPRSALDDELNRYNEESPAGLFNERHLLLYDSPGGEALKWW